jgi:hypothetical protein
MPTQAEFRNATSGGALPGYLAVTLAAAVGLLMTATIGMTTGFVLGMRGSSWWRAAHYLAALVTWPQWLGLGAWAAITGALVSTGVRRSVVGTLLPVMAFFAGALVPVGLVFFAGALNHVWPGTNGPTDAPALTLLLLLYSLVVPWGLGRATGSLARRSSH